MALETLKGLEKINETNVNEIDDQNVEYSGMMPTADAPIVVDHNENTIFFKIQNGPIKEVGKNGCQVDDLIGIAKHMLVGLNEKFACHENAMAILKLQEALEFLEMRRNRRVAQGTEGTSNEITE